MRTVLVLTQDQMGSGDRTLGERLLATMLRKAPGAFGELEAIALYNSGVKLVCDGSPVLVELSQLLDAGVDILPCGTCLEHFGIEPRVGRISDMETILREVERAQKIVTI